MPMEVDINNDKFMALSAATWCQPVGQFDWSPDARIELTCLHEHSNTLKAAPCQTD